MKFLKLDRIGLPGAIGAVLIVFCLGFYLVSVRPAQELLAARQREEAKLEREAARVAVPARDQAAAARADARALPPISEAPELLKALTALAGKHGIAADRATFVLDERGGQRRIQVKLPLKGAYPPLRAYLRELQTLSPSTSLDDVILQRKDATEATIDATVRLSFDFAPT